jgi:hypothetical protein
VIENVFLCSIQDYCLWQHNNYENMEKTLITFSQLCSDLANGWLNMHKHQAFFMCTYYVKYKFFKYLNPFIGFTGVCERGSMIFEFYFSVAAPPPRKICGGGGSANYGCL